tara:strand:+ start:109 stop:591 length:483 start_codon:yes stop_codon:yes gene_type:complete
MKPASKAQTWKLFTLTKKDYRNELLSYEEADKLIQDALKEKDNKLQEFQTIIDKAKSAGLKAVKELKVIPMTVVSHQTGKEYFVEDGLCGFAWVNLYPATSSFARWLKKEGIGRKGYPSGLSIWIDDFNQSLQKKETYARAYAEVLRDYGYKAYSSSRMD